MPEKEGIRNDHLGITQEQRGLMIETGAPTATLSLAPPRINTDLFELMNVKGKGFGLVAKVDIERGTMIIEEEAVLTEAMFMQAKDRVTMLPARFAALAHDEKLRFATLARTEYQYNEIFAAIDLEIRPKEPSEDRINELYFGAILHSIVVTNSFSSGVHPTVSRINHSCVPNCEAYDLSSGTCSIQAIQNIKAGTELTICYTDYLYNYDCKFDHLIYEHGFICQCVACGPETRGDFENRRGRLRRLARDIDFLQCRLNVDAGNPAKLLMDSDYSIEPCPEGPVAASVSNTKLAYAALNDLELLLREEPVRTSFIQFM